MSPSDIYAFLWCIGSEMYIVYVLLSQVVQSLRPYEVQRQEYIKELAYTERTHLHKLKTMKYVSRLHCICTCTNVCSIDCIYVMYVYIHVYMIKYLPFWSLSYISQVNLIVKSATYMYCMHYVLNIHLHYVYPASVALH